ncbi:MAG TPA: hypothetical protein VFL13_11935 [Candidatus Baltobacteraceae bacterium]|nr:hypothetical protein [Candidatus Baltobacteraceae bacterium]
MSVLGLRDFVHMRSDGRLLIVDAREGEAVSWTPLLCAGIWSWCTRMKSARWISITF